jgi:hypothetical protein
MQEFEHRKKKKESFDKRTFPSICSWTAGGSPLRSGFAVILYLLKKAGSKVNRVKADLAGEIVDSLSWMNSIYQERSEKHIHNAM